MYFAPKESPFIMLLFCVVGILICSYFFMLNISDLFSDNRNNSDMNFSFIKPLLILCFMLLLIPPKSSHYHHPSLSYTPISSPMFRLLGGMLLGHHLSRLPRPSFPHIQIHFLSHSLEMEQPFCLIGLHPPWSFVY